MDGKSIRNKLIGSDDERAVSPVIGVILMVAITVILAAVIAAFVLDMGSGMNESANAGVDTSVDTANEEVEVSVTSMGNAEEIVLRGDIGDSEVDSVSGGPVSSSPASDYSEEDHALEEVGQSITIGYTGTDDSGTITVVAITEDGTETQITSQDYDFTSS